MAVINIPTPLRKFANNQSSVKFSGETIKQVIQNFANENPEIKGHLFDGAGNLRKFMRIYLGDTDIKTLNNEETQVEDDAVINIIPAIAGGLNQ
jgi:sulfur-carrier protein